jgi:hypothetical protein
MRTLIICLGFALLAGCAMHHPSRPPYDPQITVSVRELYFRTKSVVEDGNAKRLSLADSRQFLKQSRMKAKAVRQQIVQTKTTVGEQALLDSLDQEYQSLLRRQRPLRGPAAANLMADLEAWQDIRPLPDTRVYQIADYATPDVSTPDTSDNSNNSKCDKGHGDHGDHGGRDCGCSNGRR